MQHGKRGGSPCPFLPPSGLTTMPVARVDAQGRQITYPAHLADLPDGVFVTIPETPGQPLAFWQGKLHSWSHQGYGAPLETLPESMVTVLTPLPLVRTLAADYRPEIALHVGACPIVT